MPLRTPTWVLAIVVGFLQVAGSFGAANGQPDRKAIDALAVVLALLGPAALALRDRWPLVPVVVSSIAANVYVGLGYPFGPIFVSVAVALFLAVQTARRRSTWVLAVLTFVGFVVAARMDPKAITEPGLLHFALVAGWISGLVALSEAVRIRREQRAERLRAERSERQRGVAQELHDVLAHTISLINVQASVALHLVDEQPERAKPALETIKAASHEALQELRAALDVLRRGDDDDAPRAPAPRLADLEALVVGVRNSGLDVGLVVEGEPRELPNAVELAAFRIVQEALTNVTRHARARRATVRVAYGDGVTVEVTDDGAGGAMTPGNGIVGMRERAATLGGTLDAGPLPGGGFRVVAYLPERRP